MLLPCLGGARACSSNTRERQWRQHTETTAGQQRRPGFRLGQSGNPAGRPPGARNKTTLASEALLEGEGEALTRKAIELAKAGDLTATATRMGPAISIKCKRLTVGRMDRAQCLEGGRSARPVRLGLGPSRLERERTCRPEPS